MDRIFTSVTILVWARLLLGGPVLLAYPVPFDMNGQLARWNISKDDPIIYYEVASSDATTASLVALVDEAASMWTAVAESYLILQPADLDHQAQITVYFDDAIEVASSSGYSEFTSYDSQGYPLRCKAHIGLDADYYSLSKTVLHELGHCLGLGHSMIPQAIMSYHLTENDFKIDTDDAAALSSLYPVDETQGGLPPGCGTMGGSPLTMKRWWLMWFVFLVPLLGPCLLGHWRGVVSFNQAQ